MSRTLFLVVAALLATSARSQTVIPLVREGDVVPGVGPVTNINHVTVFSPWDWIVEVDTDTSNTARSHTVSHTLSQKRGKVCDTVVRPLDYGGVMIHDIPTLRVDDSPYGGTKDSGFGREDVRYALEEMTEPRVLVLRGLGG